MAKSRASSLIGRRGVNAPNVVTAIEGDGELWKVSDTCFHETERTKEEEEKEEEKEEKEKEEKEEEKEDEGDQGLDYERGHNITWTETYESN